jgi:hypothetical protein
VTNKYVATLTGKQGIILYRIINTGGIRSDWNLTIREARRQQTYRSDNPISERLSDRFVDLNLRAELNNRDLLRQITDRLKTAGLSLKIRR